MGVNRCFSSFKYLILTRSSIVSVAEIRIIQQVTFVKKNFKLNFQRKKHGNIIYSYKALRVPRVLRDIEKESFSKRPNLTNLNRIAEPQKNRLQLSAGLSRNFRFFFLSLFLSFFIYFFFFCWPSPILIIKKKQFCRNQHFLDTHSTQM